MPNPTNPPRLPRYARNDDDHICHVYGSEYVSQPCHSCESRNLPSSVIARSDSDEAIWEGCVMRLNTEVN